MFIKNYQIRLTKYCGFGYLRINGKFYKMITNWALCLGFLVIIKYKGKILKNK